MEPTGVAAPSIAESPTITSPAMTQAGMILGTAAYMSPEQARGTPVDTRADVWAFGCVLFEMLAGRRCFERLDSISDAIVAILTRDPDWRALPPNTPEPIRRLLRRCLIKNAARRLHHLADARLEIEEALTSPIASSTIHGSPATQGPHKGNSLDDRGRAGSGGRRSRGPAPNAGAHKSRAACRAVRNELASRCRGVSRSEPGGGILSRRHTRGIRRRKPQRSKWTGTYSFSPHD